MSTKIVIAAAVLIAAGIRAAVPMAAQKSAITFSEHVAPIVYANCVTCHRPGEAAPLSLISYADVRRAVAARARESASRYMPPWRATADQAKFADARPLPETLTSTIA